jgi:hypothetical protein
MSRRTIVASFAVLVCCGTLNAANMSVSTTAPTVDGADIAQLAGLNDPGGDLGHVWSNRPVHGQTFTTGSAAGGYFLSSVSMLARVDQPSTTSPQWDIRVGTVDGTLNLNVTGSETAAGVAIPNTSATANPQWVTWTFDTPIVLSPNTLYGFDVDSSGSGFISLNNPGDVLAGSTAFSSGGGGNPANPLTLHGFDRVFHANLDVVPEPASALLLTAGILLTARRRHRG